jgi:hypothetical protein
MSAFIVVMAGRSSSYHYRGGNTLANFYPPVIPHLSTNIDGELDE